MPPRLSLLRTPRLRLPTHTSPASTFLLPLAPNPSPSTSITRQPTTQQRRSASILSSISDVPAAYQKRIRLGRGPASGKGKTSGRGHKGQKQHGKVPRGFNGGQTKDEIVTPVRGVGNRVTQHFGVDLAKVNVDRIQEWIDQGRLDPAKPITLVELHKSRVTHGIKDGVKLLARNKEALRTPINIVVSRASQQAIEAVERCGGTVTTRYYTNASIRRILKGETDPIHSMMSNFPGSPYVLPTSLDAASEASAESQSDPSTETVPGGASDAPAHLQPSASAAIFAQMSLQKKKYPYRLPDAHSRKDLEYYRDPAHRGYLAYMVKAHEGPSLFFKPSKSKELTKEESLALRKEKLKKQAAKGQLTETRLW